MSSWVGIRITSPCCKEGQLVHVAKTLNLARTPAIRDTIIRGGLHVARCPRCDQPFYIDTTFTVADIPNDEYYLVMPRRRRGDWAALEPVARETFARPLEENPHMASRAQNARVRLVFGLGELREKILLMRESLDDHVVELMKKESLTQVFPPGFEGRVIFDYTGDEWVFRADGRESVPFDRARYDALLGSRTADLTGATYVSYERFVSVAEPSR